MSGSPLLRCACGSVFVPDAVFCRRCGARRPMGVQADWPPQQFGQWPQAAGAAVSAGSAPRTPGAAACSAAPFAGPPAEPVAHTAPARLLGSTAILSGSSADFDRIDADGDGVITRSEFMFDRLDRNHDGVISRAEFEAAVNSGQLAGSHFREADRLAPARLSAMQWEGLAGVPAGGLGPAPSEPESATRSHVDMNSRVGAATVHKLVGTTKNLLQGLEEALLLRAGFLAGAFHAWRCDTSLRKAARESERRFQQHLARSQQEWASQIEELRRQAEAGMRHGGAAAAQAMRIRIASHFFAGGAIAVKKETWRTWRVYCRLEARRHSAFQQAELVFLQSSARGTLHVVLSSWHKEVHRQQLHRHQKEIDDAKKQMQQQLGSQANHGVALVMKKFLASSRTGALVSAWRAWRQMVAVNKAAAEKARSARQVLHAMLNGNRQAMLRAYLANWRSQQVSSAAERARRLQLEAEQAARLEAERWERGRQKQAAHTMVEQMVRKWAFGDRRGLLVWTVQEWCKLVASQRAAKRLRETTCLTMIRAVEGDRRGLLHGVFVRWLHEARHEAARHRHMRELEEKEDHRRRREKELEAAKEEAARRKEKDEAVLKLMMEKWFKGDKKALRAAAFREWRKMSVESRMKETQRQSVSWAIRRFFEGGQKASLHGAFLSWRGQAQRQRYEAAVEDAVERQRQHWEEARRRMMEHHQSELDGFTNDRMRRRDKAHATVESVLRHWATGSIKDLVEMVFQDWRGRTELLQKARSLALQAERGSWRSSGRLAMACWRTFVVLGVSYKQLEKKVEHLLLSQRSILSKYMCMMRPNDEGAVFGAWKEYVQQERLRCRVDADRTRKQQVQVSALRGLSTRCRRGALHEAFGAWKVVYHRALEALSSRMAKNEWVMKLSGVFSKKATPHNLKLLSTCLNEWCRESYRMRQQALHDATLKARAAADESGGHAGQLAQQLVGLQEQLWLAYQENDKITQTYQKELQCKEELMAQLRDATHKARLASPGPPAGVIGAHTLQAPASLLGPDRAATPPHLRAHPRSGRISPVLAEPLAVQPQRQTPPGSSGCDWDEAVRRMRTEGLVRMEGQRT